MIHGSEAWIPHRCLISSNKNRRTNPKAVRARVKAAKASPEERAVMHRVVTKDHKGLTITIGRVPRNYPRRRSANLNVILMRPYVKVR